MNRFPEDFLWGGATAANQYEGGWNAGVFLGNTGDDRRYLCPVCGVYYRGMGQGRHGDPHCRTGGDVSCYSEQDCL